MVQIVPWGMSQPPYPHLSHSASIATLICPTVPGTSHTSLRREVLLPPLVPSHLPDPEVDPRSLPQPYCGPPLGQVPNRAQLGSALHSPLVPSPHPELEIEPRSPDSQLARALTTRPCCPCNAVLSSLLAGGNSCDSPECLFLCWRRSDGCRRLLSCSSPCSSVPSWSVLYRAPPDAAEGQWEGKCHKQPGQHNSVSAGNGKPGPSGQDGGEEHSAPVLLETRAPQRHVDVCLPFRPRCDCSTGRWCRASFHLPRCVIIASSPDCTVADLGLGHLHLPRQS